ncbi:hypothetical protein EFV37_35865 (plasmid) [Mesorhizobium loti]|uniref:Uncharacterized protein n=1 Tax=Mesorhizobium jarvisii TaxID=1777867 RepID=A0A6M7TX52_9HYPH|nr:MULTISPECIES: hypothetical protein [Mesorhizobium]OBQ66502.1 hypothetical protein A9K72_34700 [Mesorhizobium loti]QKC67667.1 hypothetical protein EB229_35920 [Mesorhizobium jarvisii]QKD13571.1 hypothetical protein EFV37_35865 [Mesorhizobium loti]RJT28190.1 hypothetical protein D3242_33035 [Mesorhizobium jarvisii]
MPAPIYDQYAAKICRHASLAAGLYEGQDLNDVVMALPLGEGHAVLAGTEFEELPRLGETVSVNSHMQANFFDVIGMDAKELHEFTAPILVRRGYIERLEGWREWRTLSVWLLQEYLEPVVVFRNTPVPVKTAAFEQTDYYVADVRVIFNRAQPFHWNG